MSKFITEPKQAKLDRDNGKQADPQTVIDLAFSDLVQRGIVAKAWGYNREESAKLIKAAIKKWLAYNMEQAQHEQENGVRKEQPERATIDEVCEKHRGEPAGDSVEAGLGREGPPPGVGR